MKNHTSTLPNLLLSGFDAFGGESINPSWEAVRQLDGSVIVGHRIATVQLPTRFRDSIASLKRAIARTDPALVLCVGQAGGRSQVGIERIAINVDDARIADNAGHQPVDRPVVRGGPAAYFSTLPIKAMLAAARRNGLPTEISQTAGTFVCNHVFYGLMHLLRDTPDVRGGFVHIPFLPEQAALHPGAPSLAQGTVVATLQVLLEAALRTRRDRRIAAGATH
ncbi:MAG: pyroglutamyl-peptidase I [Tahibacter sp.]